MIKSMTGYGKGVSTGPEIEATIEIRSVNHRFFDVSIKCPKVLDPFEHEIREIVRKYVGRGRISVNVVLGGDAGQSTSLQLNIKAVKQYRVLLSDLSVGAGVPDSVQLEHLLTFPDLFVTKDQGTLSSSAWNVVAQALGEACDNLRKMCRREGDEIQKDLVFRVNSLSGRIADVEKMVEGRSQVEFKKLLSRVQGMVQKGEIDESRLELEVALLADRVDVTEECIRFKSHNVLFMESITSDEPSGRKLNFLLQEMNREANTIGSKANNAEIAHVVVGIKEEVEKLREQVQNIE